MTVIEPNFEEAKRALRRRPKDWKGFFLALDLGAKSGELSAQAALGAWYLEGHQMLKRSPKKAFELITRAARRGSGDAALLLAYGYDSGLWGKRQIELAVKWYKIAANRGEWVAPMNISIIYKEVGNRRAEMRWLRKAAKLGDPDAEERLRTG